MFSRAESPKNFSSPEEEIKYLRARIAERDRDLIAKNKEAEATDFESVAAAEIRAYGEHDPRVVLTENHRMVDAEVASHAENLHIASHKVEEILTLARARGLRNALSVLEKTGNAYLTDEVHRALIIEVRAGRTLAGIKEGVPLWALLHMTLFEVSLPEESEEKGEHPLRELISAMEQFYAGMHSVSKGKHFTLELAVSNNSDHIIFYVAVPTEDSNLFEKQLLSLFPNAVVVEQRNDYNIFVEGGDSRVSVAHLKKHSVYPLKTYDMFDHDPLKVLLNAFSKIEKEAGGAAIQIALRYGGDTYAHTYRDIIKHVRDGIKPEKAIRLSTFGGELIEGVKDLFKSEKSREKEEEKKSVDDEALEQFNAKMESPIFEADIRIIVSTAHADRSKQILSEIESSFNQFENTKGNRFEWTHPKGSALRAALKAFSFREFATRTREILALSTKELSGIIHFPVEGMVASPQFKQSRAKTAPAPLDMPTSGTRLGTNVHRNQEIPIYVSGEDRLRHLYIIGQTGTGKTSLMKNIIAEDINAGNGVCFIDPHGTDIADVIANIPKEREKDLIYFDPSYMDRVIGLNMLEYDAERPEQKTFVVNELFSIFQKLYGAIPESMGPMFEQYFRNATLLVLEDPESGSTLLEISRVMSDATFRAQKLAKASNPVVVDFWTKIATQADGEASLANIVPYITSKFDIFTANDFIRPIVGQQTSSFNFRTLMDEKKILLVNLSKGRLGEINADLIGMIIVGKILMAALSRVDDLSHSYPPFYLHIDEFQNVTTNSISAILSEARKYKLGLTIAHQFIAQLDENIRDAVFGNVGSLAVFRVGSDDAEFLEKQLTPVFDAQDVMNISNYNAYMRILAGGTPTKPFSMKTLPPQAGEPDNIVRLIQESYRTYGTPRRKIEMEIATRYQQV